MADAPTLAQIVVENVYAKVEQRFEMPAGIWFLQLRHTLLGIVGSTHFIDQIFEIVNVANYAPLQETRVVCRMVIVDGRAGQFTLWRLR